MLLFTVGILALLMVGAAIWVVLTTDLLKAIIIFAVVSLIASALFLFMNAPDVAITEAAIGAGLTTAIFLFSYRRINESKESGDRSQESE